MTRSRYANRDASKSLIPLTRRYVPSILLAFHIRYVLLCLPPHIPTSARSVPRSHAPTDTAHGLSRSHITSNCCSRHPRQGACYFHCPCTVSYCFFWKYLLAMHVAHCHDVIIAFFGPIYPISCVSHSVRVSCWLGLRKGVLS